jgi:hypothetical protein
MRLGADPWQPRRLVRVQALSASLEDLAARRAQHGLAHVGLPVELGLVELGAAVLGLALAVALSAMGRVSPKPTATRRSALTPAAINHRFTARARSPESFMLWASSPSLSVWPSMRIW